MKWKASKWTANIFLKQMDESVVTELLGVTPKRQTFIHEAGARETSAEAFSPVCSSGVPGKLSPEINPSSVIRSVIKLLPLCITPPPTSTQSPSLPSYTLHCARAGTWRAAKLKGRKIDFVTAPLGNFYHFSVQLLRSLPRFIPGADRLPPALRAAQCCRQSAKLKGLRSLLPSAQRSHL